MTASKLLFPAEKLSQTSAGIFLGIATVALASTAILIKICLQEISTDATVFNRL